MHPAAWVAVGVTLGVLICPGTQIVARLILERPLVYPKET